MPDVRVEGITWPQASTSKAFDPSFSFPPTCCHMRTLGKITTARWKSFPSKQINEFSYLHSRNRYECMLAAQVFKNLFFNISRKSLPSRHLGFWSFAEKIKATFRKLQVSSIGYSPNPSNRTTRFSTQFGHEKVLVEWFMVVRFGKKKLIAVDDANPFREEQFLNGSSSIWDWCCERLSWKKRDWWTRNKARDEGQFFCDLTLFGSTCARRKHSKEDIEKSRASSFKCRMEERCW